MADNRSGPSITSYADVTSDQSELAMHENEVSKNQGVTPIVAATIASTAYLIPYWMNRSTSPTPNHPAIFAWYRGLRKPAFNPPDVVFPLAWLAIESTLACSGYRLMRRASTPARNLSLGLLAGNVLGIGAWGRLFFGTRNLPMSTVAAVALGGSAAAYVVKSAKVDRPAAALGVPLGAWVACATLLTASIWRKNR
jgi:benzodiazapine receptor